MATKSNKPFDEIEKAVWYFIRNEYKDKYDVDVPLSLKYLTMQFSKRVIGCNMLTIREDLDFYDLLLSKLGEDLLTNKFKLLFRASEYQYKVSEFHKLCDGQGPTITIIKSNFFENIFGGFTSIKWASAYDGSYRDLFDRDDFLFLLCSIDERIK